MTKVHQKMDEKKQNAIKMVIITYPWVQGWRYTCTKERSRTPYAPEKILLYPFISLIKGHQDSISMLVKMPIPKTFEARIILGD